MRALVTLVALIALAASAGAAEARSVNGCALKHHAKCAGIDLSGRDLRGVKLHHADLHGANLEGADLRGASLRHANLRGARLRGAKLHHHPRRGRGARSTPACSPNCQGADLSHVDLTNAQLAGADLRYANLTSANLTGAELRSANLAYANLTSATLTGADFTGAANCTTASPAGVLAGAGCADETATVCYRTSPYTAQTGTFLVTSNSFSQISTYMLADNDTQITSLTVQAWVVATGFNITSTGRLFTVYFSGATSNGFSQSLAGNQAPWSTYGGTAPQSRGWDVADTGYGVAGAGRIRVNGGGTLGTWSTNPDQRIRVVVYVSGTTRVAVPCA